MVRRFFRWLLCELTGWSLLEQEKREILIWEEIERLHKSYSDSLEDVTNWIEEVKPIIEERKLLTFIEEDTVSLQDIEAQIREVQTRKWSYLSRTVINRQDIKDRNTQIIAIEAELARLNLQKDSILSDKGLH